MRKELPVFSDFAKHSWETIHIQSAFSFSMLSSLHNEYKLELQIKISCNKKYTEI